MERLVDDCIMMDYGKILIQKPIDELLKEGRRYTCTVPEGYELPASDDFYHPSVMRNTLKHSPSSPHRGGSKTEIHVSTLYGPA